MKDLLSNTHPAFKLNGISYTHQELKEVAYSLVKEGTEFEIPIGDFLLDWLSNSEFLTVLTSGSTAAPKNLTLAKQQMLNSALATGQFFDLQPGDKALLCLSADYIAGKMMLVRAMVLGLELDYVEPSSYPLHNIHTTYDFGAMVPLQLKNSLDKIEKFSTLLVGGAPVSLALKKAVSNKETQIYETFGMTETITHIALKKLSELEIEEHFQTLPGITVSVDDNDCLIINAPEIASGPVVTKDIVELISESAFKWMGRYDNLINSGGIKLIPERIEAKLAPSIASRFFVSGLPDESLGQKLVLLVEGDQDIAALSAKIKSLKTLQKYEIPREIYCLPSFEETVNGKIKRRESCKALGVS